MLRCLCVVATNNTLTIIPRQKTMSDYKKIVFYQIKEANDISRGPREAVRAVEGYCRDNDSDCESLLPLLQDCRDLGLEGLEEGALGIRTEISSAENEI